METKNGHTRAELIIKPGERVELYGMVFRVLPALDSVPEKVVIEELIGGEKLRIYLPRGVHVVLEKFGNMYIIKELKPNLWQILRTFGTREDVVYYIMPAAIITSRYNSFPVLFELSKRPNIWVYFKHPLIKKEWFAEIGPY